MSYIDWKKDCEYMDNLGHGQNICVILRGKFWFPVCFDLIHNWVIGYGQKIVKESDMAFW